VRLLLDTHVFVWWLLTPERLSGRAREAIAEAGASVYVSAVSAWEIAIKKATGKLDVPGDVEAQIRANRFTPLSISVAHAAATEHLPPHHRDPFDRMLVAQARVEHLTLVTRDAQLGAYGVEILPA